MTDGKAVPNRLQHVEVIFLFLKIMKIMVEEHQDMTGVMRWDLLHLRCLVMH